MTLHSGIEAGGTRFVARALMGRMSTTIVPPGLGRPADVLGAIALAARAQEERSDQETFVVLSETSQVYEEAIGFPSLRGARASRFALGTQRDYNPFLDC